MKTYNTDDLFPPAQDAPISDGQATRFIDVHIYDVGPEGDEPPTVESQLAAEPAAPQEDTQEPPKPVQPSHRSLSIRPLVVVGLALCLLLAGIVSMVSLVPMLAPTATVTIVPISKQITTNSVITIVAGQTPTAEQIAGRALPAVTMSQQQTVPTTGKVHQDARAAHGFLTFYNAATYSQVIPAGTMVTGTDGGEIITDQDAIIPAASYPTFGQSTVAAHAVVTGPAGNIAGGDIYGPCCRLNVSAVNGPFTGGKLARDYRTVTAQDIRTVATSLDKGVVQSVQAALQTQVHTDETLITPLACQQHITPDHQPGEEARQVQITVSETCTGMTYTTQAYQSRLTQIMDQQAGDGYFSLGEIQSSITQATVQDHHRTQLHVSMAQDYAYHISQEQQQRLKILIAGKEKAQAISLLLHVPGIQSVSVSSATIPMDIQHIRVIVVYAG
ncbi:MAG TPA: hypothetical protein VEL31_02735 [Ktedonobacteraceae bacterium]|nr:hypothetical protein [Ktedonobacteraceae bacterium]